MSIKDTELNQVEKDNSDDDIVIRNKISIPFVQLPKIVFRCTNVHKEALWIWSYFLSCEPNWKTSSAVTQKILGIPASNYKRHKKQLRKHNIISIEKIPNIRGGSGKARHQITPNHPSEWIDITWSISRLPWEKTGTNMDLVNRDQYGPGNRDQYGPGNENKKKIKNNTRATLIDILNREQFLDSKAFFDSLSDQNKEKVLMSFEKDIVRYDFDSMSQDDLTALMQQVLKEDEKNRHHVLNKDLPLKKSIVSENKVPPSRLPPPEKQALGRSIDGIRGVRSYLGSRLKKGGIPFDGWEERESALTEFENLYRQNGEYVLNWIDAAISYNEGKQFKKDKITMADMFNDPTSTFETYMKGLK
jgi:hypothetical protein